MPICVLESNSDSRQSDIKDVPVELATHRSSDSIYRSSAELPGELLFPNHKPYMEFKLSNSGLVQFFVVSFLVSVAILHITDPVDIPNISTHPRTLHSLKNYKIYENGTKYFDYVDPKTGEKSHGLLFGWFDEVLKGKHVYFFGKAFDNFCWPRKPSEEEWFPSLFRASQLKPLVQVPLRFAILIGFGFRMFYALVLGFMKLYHKDSTFHRSILASFVLNELVHNVSLFGICNYLVTPDKNYLYLFLPALTATYITFGLKMVFSLWHLGIHILTFIRIGLFLILSTTFNSVSVSTYTYLQHNYCDNLTQPFHGALELLAVVCLVTAELMDVIQCRKLEMRIDVTQEEIDSTNWKQQNLKTEVTVE